MRWADAAQAGNATVEWISLTLEFHGQNDAASAPSDYAPANAEQSLPQSKLRQRSCDPLSTLRAVGERKRDPFSILRADVNPRTPEDSRFLHPVLRYYHKAREAEPLLVSTLHIIEDFMQSGQTFSSTYCPWRDGCKTWGRVASLRLAPWLTKAMSSSQH